MFDDFLNILLSVLPSLPFPPQYQAIKFPHGDSSPMSTDFDEQLDAMVASHAAKLEQATRSKLT
jgi:hypothetical protein